MWSWLIWFLPESVLIDLYKIVWCFASTSACNQWDSGEQLRIHGNDRNPNSCVPDCVKTMKKNLSALFLFLLMKGGLLHTLTTSIFKLGNGLEILKLKEFASATWFGSKMETFSDEIMLGAQIPWIPYEACVNRVYKKFIIDCIIRTFRKNMLNMSMCRCKYTGTWKSRFFESWDSQNII